MFRIYTDGGCSGNPGPGGWAFVILHDDAGEPVAEKSGGEKTTTNNRMELLAVISALEKLKELRLPAQTGTNAKEPATVYTDSQYVQKGITEWLPNWKRKNWTTAGKTPVKNKDLWQRLDALCSDADGISWQWVKGHAGNEWNERCDLLVREATARWR